MVKLGSHVSVAGGLAKGIQRAVDLDCDVIQIFTKNNNQWSAKPLTGDQIDDWRSALLGSALTSPIAHASYLINLASPDEVLWNKSIDALADELRRGEQLGLEGVVVHPGAHTTASPDEGMARIVDACVRVIQDVGSIACRLLLENTAGQGTCLGHSIQQLACLYDGITPQIESSTALGFCVDTCHAFVAGYPIHTPGGMADFKREWTDALPIASIHAMHLNDSKKPLGSRVDRHEHIGRGEIGTAAFAMLLNDPDFSVIPGYLETEKGIDPDTRRDWDAINLEVLRGLID